LKGTFFKLKYPEKPINSAINHVHHPPDLIHAPSESPIWMIIPTLCIAKIRNPLMWFTNNFTTLEEKLIMNRPYHGFWHHLHK